VGGCPTGKGSMGQPCRPKGAGGAKEGAAFHAENLAVFSAFV
jgi:hypothetical protein